MYPIADPQAIRDPRPDTNTWYQSGTNGLQLDNTSGTGPNQDGFPGEGMLVIQWGWNPIGGARDFTDPLTPNALVGVGQVGQATIGSTGTPAFTLVEVLYTTPGTYSWTAPTGLTSIYVLCIGGGGHGSQSTPIATSSYFGSASLVTGFVAGPGQRGTAFSGGTGGGGSGSTSLGGSVYGGNGGNGAASSTSTQPGGGGGAGGYSGNGGNGGNATASFTAGSGGGGAGGTYVSGTDALSGGGVGVAGQGSSGIVPGQGGSGGTDGTTTTPGLYGAGGRGLFAVSANGGGGGGALRWTPNRTVTPLTTYAIRVGAGGSTSINPHAGGSGAVKIAYWQPIP
jgi:hypothetical protein